MRDYTHIDYYLDSLLGDIYPQPQDPGHTALAQEAIDLYCSRLADCHSVLDVGCGEGFCQPMFEKFGIKYTGVTLGKDYLESVNQGRNVKKMDFSFLDFPDESFDLTFSRHSLEHSPMPILTLMEWHRVTRNWLFLVVPAPEHYTFEGVNHYSVMNMEQIKAILPRAGWNIMWFDIKDIVIPSDGGQPPRTVPQEYWAFCEKVRKK